MRTCFLFCCFVSAFLVSALQGQCQKEKKPYTPIGTTNNIYDNAVTADLSSPVITVEGEVKNPGRVDLSKLPVSSVVVKETVMSGDSVKFTGAFRYDGYSLLNILNDFVINKANAEEFPPQVDLFVEITNDKNEKAVFSWGEIFYTPDANSIIIANKVMRIIPEKTGELWELPTECKVVCSKDRITERNISNPVKITVRSYKNDTIKIIKGKNPVYSPVVNFFVGKEKINTLDSYNGNKEKTIRTIFYGKGRGLHSTEPYTGISLGDFLRIQIKTLNKKSIQNGLWVLVSDDGYRSVFTYSELCNRNDNGEAIMNFNKENKNGGAFRLIAGFDFFSDRAVKSVRDIYYIEP